MRILFAFPEPLPIAKARSLQVVRTASAIAESGIEVVLMHEQGEADPFSFYGHGRPDKLSEVLVSRAMPWPFEWVVSNRFFYRRAMHALSAMPGINAVFTRHLKFAARFLQEDPQIPLVYEAHEVFADTAPKGKRRQRALEESTVVSKAAAIVANSNATARRLVELYGPAQTLEVVPNGVDRKDARPEKDWSTARRRIVYAGSLFPWKGVDDLIAAGAWMAGHQIEIIGGDDDRIEKLKERISPGGAEFRFSGRLSHDEVMSRLERHCIAVLPNRDEPDSAFTSPIKLFEYLASGCAIVASDLAPIREILHDEDAQWAMPGDPASLAKAIIAISSDCSRAAVMGSRLFDRAGKYTWAARGERLKSILLSVAKG